MKCTPSQNLTWATYSNIDVEITTNVEGDGNCLYRALALGLQNTAFDMSWERIKKYIWDAAESHYKDDPSVQEEQDGF